MHFFTGMGGNTEIDFDRRHLLQKLGAVTGMTCAGPVLFSSLVVGEELPVPPSERIGLGVIGLGKMCSGHLNGLLHRRDVHIVALSDVERDRLEKCKKRVEDCYAERYAKGSYKGCDIYGDFRELLLRPDIDAVLIATPTNWHAVMSIEAMKAGKDVYCEKPLALTIREADAIVRAEKRYNRVFQTGSQQRSDQKFRFACELVRNGCIGEVKRIHVNVGGPPGPCFLPAEPVPETLDWDMWIGPALMHPYNKLLCPLDNYASWPRWRYYRDFGGGGMTDWGAHHFDIAQWALGMDGSGPVEILPPDGKDIKRLTYRYPNGTIMTHGGAEICGGVDLIGTTGRIGVTRGRLVVEPEELLRTKWGPSDVTLYESHHHFDNWFDCIRSREHCICPAWVGCSSVTVCHLGNIAYWLKRPLKWDPSGKNFVGDSAADRLLERAMRAPWTVA